MVTTNVSDKNFESRLNSVGENVAKVHFEQVHVILVCLGGTYIHTPTLRQVNKLYRDGHEDGKVKIDSYPYFSEYNYRPDVYNYKEISDEFNTIKYAFQCLRHCHDENKYIDFRIDTKSFSIDTAKIILTPFITLVHELFLEKYDESFARISFHDIYGHEIWL